MPFADSYLEKYSPGHAVLTSIPSPPPGDLAQVIVIPCHDEPDLLTCLDSLYRCARPPGSVEVIIIINSARGAGPQVLNANRSTLEEAKEWIPSHLRPRISFYPLLYPDFPDKYAGPGLARKTGMDLAVGRFNALDRPEGIISSLDADTTVDRGYLSGIQALFRDDPDCTGCNVDFEHPLAGKALSPAVYTAVIQYELHLRYYVQALRYTGFPYAFHTVGSVFSVRAGAYVRQGGMNRRKAGEDFYFLQKIFPLGGFRELHTTTVYPSPRPSDRVVFGTGPFISKFVRNGETDWYTYHFDAFTDLKAFFNVRDKLFRTGSAQLSQVLASLPRPVREFLADELIQKVEEINRNTATLPAFVKRFHGWFNAFKVLKYLNFAHGDYYPKIAVTDAIGMLLRERGTGSPRQLPAAGSKELLLFMRDLQKGNSMQGAPGDNK